MDDELRVVGTVPADVVGQLVAVRRLRSLEDVLAWARAMNATLEDVIV